MRLRGVFHARFTPPKQENVFEKEKKSRLQWQDYRQMEQQTAK